MFDGELTERQLEDLVTDQETQLEKQEHELDFLRFFYQEADFGPAHEDVVKYLKYCYTEAKSRDIPKGYQDAE